MAHLFICESIYTKSSFCTNYNDKKNGDKQLNNK